VGRELKKSGGEMEGEVGRRSKGGEEIRLVLLTLQYFLYG
jgi:hypothetical protein